MSQTTTGANAGIAQSVHSGASVHLKSRAVEREVGDPQQEGVQDNWYPKFNRGLDTLKFIRSKGAGQIQNGDEIFVETTQTKVGDYRRLTTRKEIVELFYYRAGYGPPETWIVETASGSEMRYGEPFALRNKEWNQTLAPYGDYLTTSRGNDMWTVRPTS